jgi:hypothetical protein
VTQLGGKGGIVSTFEAELTARARFARLTRPDYELGKASNPVVSTDGRFDGIQSANTAMQGGWEWIVLYWFPSNLHRRGPALVAYDLPHDAF